ncbi:sensor histidine kinase [Kitasatospora sp. NPDC008050]|uniref:sensor histidine kinase n=1 Tax=Kitasatospora sp. NPDC008050 TaxID=3364021 RepID=UPI0036E9B15F
MRAATGTPSGGASRTATGTTATGGAARRATRATGAPVPAGAYAVCALTLLSGLGWVVLALTHLTDRARDRDIPYDWAPLLLGFGLALAGLFILAHRSGTGLGRLLLGAGFLACLGNVTLFALGVAGAGPVLADLAATLLLISVTTFVFTMYALPLWFPDGRLPGGWGRGYAVLLLLWSAAESYYGRAAAPDWYGLPNPLTHGWWARLESDLAQGLGPRIDWLAPLVAALSLLVAVLRWRRSPNLRPQQLVVLLPWLAWMVLNFTASHLGWHGTSFFVFNSLIAALWPLALIYAFARDRSWQLDRATRRMLTSFTLIALLICGYFALGFALPRLLPAADNADAQLMAGCALVIGLLVRPTARGLSRAVDRFYYGDRARPYQVARDLAERLSQAVGPAEASPLLCRTVVDSLGLPGARVVVATREGPRELAALGAPDQPAEVFPIGFEGTVIGELHAPPRSGQAVLDHQDHAVLRFLADQCAPAIASLRLTEELQASRKQLVLAREEERKRLRHDLHDGLGPALSGLRLQVDAARSALPEDSAASSALRTASLGIGTAIDELRRITDGLAPAELGRVGLTGALRELAARLDGRRLQVQVELDPDPLPPLPAAVEVAVYRISGEALNNALRHSGALRARLALRVAADQVTVEARDDGAGFPAHAGTAGVGLRSMAERAEELGGTFTAANDARGAVVRAVLPRGGQN